MPCRPHGYSPSPGQALERARYAAGDVKLGSNDLAGLTDLPVVHSIQLSGSTR